MQIFVWSLIGFLSGSIPFSVILGRLALGVDIRQVGDSNPGATNVLRAGGWGWAIPALLLDYLKAAIPVGIAWYGIGISGWYLVPVALAPIFGHAFSPWLHFKGGKAVATTFGTWTGLTIGAGPTILGLLLGAMYAFIANSGWAVITSMLLFGLFIWSQYSVIYPEFMAIWFGNLIILIWKHSRELRQPPNIRSLAMK